MFSSCAALVTDGAGDAEVLRNPMTGILSCCASSVDYLQSCHGSSLSGGSRGPLGTIQGFPDGRGALGEGPSQNWIICASYAAGSSTGGLLILGDLISCRNDGKGRTVMGKRSRELEAYAKPGC
jgi:hypothetical protein